MHVAFVCSQPSDGYNQQTLSALCKVLNTDCHSIDCQLTIIDCQSLRSAAQLFQDLSTTANFCHSIRLNSPILLTFFFHSIHQNGNSQKQQFQDLNEIFILHFYPQLQASTGHYFVQFKMVLISVVICSATPKLREKDLF